MNGFIGDFLGNTTIWVAVLSWFIAQAIKITVDIIRTRELKLSLLFSSGGMPSSHSSFVSAAATVIGLQSGFYSDNFAVAVVIALVVMHDAAGVRRAAGTHAMIINTIIKNVENSGVVIDKKLKELLGHSPIEVATGAILGVLIALLAVRP